MVRWLCERLATCSMDMTLRGSCSGNNACLAIGIPWSMRTHVGGQLTNKQKKVENKNK